MAKDRAVDIEEQDLNFDVLPNLNIQKSWLLKKCTHYLMYFSIV